MTIGQADTINQLYKSYNDTISVLKSALTIKNIKYDSLFSYNTFQKDSVNLYKWKYQANRDAYTERQKDYWKTEKIHEASKLILVGIIILQFTTISQLHNKINNY